MSRFVEELIEGALKEAEADESTKLAQEDDKNAVNHVDKLADFLDKVASVIEEKYVKKQADKSLGEKKKDNEYSDKLRQIFIGQDVDEKSMWKRQQIKRRLEEKGGVAAPGI